jgi:ComF family protein
LLGRLFYRELKENGWLNQIDLLVPVPLHPQKEKKRGYNQAAVFARGLSQASSVPCFEKGLTRKKPTESQTKKSRIGRWENVSDIFEAPVPGMLENKHVLLLDDVVTTGATLEACTIALQKIPGVRVSVATLACTFG